QLTLFRIGSVALPRTWQGQELYPSLKENIAHSFATQACSIVKDAKRIGQCAMLHVGSFAELHEFTKVETCVITATGLIAAIPGGKRLLYVIPSFMVL